MCACLCVCACACVPVRVRVRAVRVVPRVQQLGILGEGSFGIVRMVRYEEGIYALKRLWKSEVRQARQVKVSGGTACCNTHTA